MLRARLEAAEARIEAQADDLAATKARVAAAEENVSALQDKVSGLDDLEETVKSQGLRLTALHETQQAMGARFDKRFEAAEGALARVEGRVGSVEGAASRLEGRVDKLKEELLVPAHNVTLPADLQAEGEAGGSEDDVAKLTHLLGVFRGAAQESEIPNFKGSDLGHFPLVSADFWTSDHLSERSRSVDVFSVTRARGTLTLKRR